MLTKEMVTARRDQLARSQADALQRRDVAAAEAVAIGGALKDCDYWLAQLDAPEPAEGKE